MGIRNRIAVLVCFAAAMGYLEAAVVVYLQRAIGLTPADLFPIRDVATLDGLAAAEVALEAATLIMLWAIGWLLGRTGVERLAWTAIAFGVWDIVYYDGLYMLLGWPTALGTWDLLFLIPVPWAGPVWTPIAVSVALIGFGIAYVRRFADDHPVHLRRVEWLALLTGGMVVVIAFCWNATLVLDKGVPSKFPVPAFLIGMAISCIAAIRPLQRYGGSTVMDTHSDN